MSVETDLLRGDNPTLALLIPTPLSSVTLPHTLPSISLIGVTSQRSLNESVNCTLEIESQNILFAKSKDSLWSA